MSTLLQRAGIPHAFSTRLGGVSPAPFDSLNFGNPGDLPAERKDPPANIRANFERLLKAMEVPARCIAQVHQVHGGEVRVVSRAGRSPGAGADARPLYLPGPDPKADAIVADDPAMIACVRIADCAPVLIASTDGRVVAAVHAGWRGVPAMVVAAAIAKMRELGATGFVAAVGPCISVEHFEVGPEVVEEFARVLGPGVAVRPASDAGSPAARAGKAHADLKEALRVQLVAAGVGQVDVLPHCTVRDASLFFSHRRDRGLTGRLVGMIGPRESS